MLEQPVQGRVVILNNSKKSIYLQRIKLDETFPSLVNLSLFSVMTYSKSHIQAPPTSLDISNSCWAINVEFFVGLLSVSASLQIQITDVRC